MLTHVRLIRTPPVFNSRLLPFLGDAWHDLSPHHQA
jgi:hypothetical protein